VALAGGGRVKVIAGSLSLQGQEVSGPVNDAVAPLRTDPLYLDVQLATNERVEIPVPQGHNAFLYLYEGDVRIGTDGAASALPRRAAGVLSDGASVALQAGAEGARALLLAARALGEPVVQYGPFVMNTRAEIEQAVEDYRSGRFGAAAATG
jgi:redox-sensitive bicupin YhaK (pirin superfamily)